MRFLFFFFIIIIQAYSLENPLQSCQKKTLIDDPAISKRLSQSLDIKNQYQYSTCVPVAMSTELNYLLNRRFEKSDREFSWTHLSIIAKKDKLNSCSIRDAQKLLQDEGNFYRDNFNNIKNYEQEMIAKSGSGLCFLPKDENGKIDRSFDEDIDTYFAWLYNLENILKGLEGEDYPVFSFYLQCRETIKRNLGLTFDSEQEVTFRDAVTACLVNKALNDINNPKFCSNMIDVSMEVMLVSENNKSIDSLKLDSLVVNKHESTFELLDSFLRFHLDCLKNSDAILSNWEAKTIGVTRDAEGLKVIRGDQRKKLYNFIEDTVGNSDVKKRRPITFSTSTQLFKSHPKLASLYEDGYHMMTAIGYAQCENSKQCMLVQNSVGSDHLIYQLDQEDLKNSILPYEINSNGEGNFSRFWICGEELIEKYIRNFSFIQTYRTII
ncbi:MAG: hypothetical protein H6620_05850 [Halobacteriovoraceae bacterium]|nr:hypothetical protein [Halobacteriovoraceae bacterium]